jgi:tetratricopeptide (TPR) repeat protein
MGTLIVGTYRPSELLLARHPFSQAKLDLQSRGICREILLDFLSREDIERYLALEFPGHDFDEEFPALIYKKTEGNPLFMADLLRFLRDRKVIAKENRGWTLVRSVLNLETEMPESVRSMIQRKIDQLSGQDRRLLIAASVQGYEFDSSVISTAIGLDPADVEERLEVLERVFAFVRLIGEREFPDGTLTQRHRFVHALYQNALYALLRPTRRAALSKAVAETLVAHHRERRPAVASELAHLFEAAREFGRAADSFLAAAQHAVQVFAYQEAAQLSRRGLGLLERLPASPERSGQELGLHVVLAFSLAVTKGYGSPETGKSFSRARELCQQIGETHLILSALWGEVAYHAIRAELAKAQELSKELLHIAQSSQDPMMLVGPYYARGFILFYLGDYVSSHEHLEQAMSLHEPGRNLAYRELYSMDPGIWSWGHTIGTLWALGYREQSRRRIEEALGLAEKASDPRAIAYVLVFAAFHYRSCGEPEMVREQAEKCIALCVEHGISHERESIGVAYGWAMAQLGHVEEGIVMIRESLASHNARGSLISSSNYLAVLADSCTKAGRIEEAMEALTRGFDFVNASNERQSEAELYRLKGELLLAQASDNENLRAASILVDAEACFQQAIEIARRQRAKSWELLAALSLARLWQKQGKRIEAREMLKEIYGWFTEGLETSDLKQARALLEELS